MPWTPHSPSALTSTIGVFWQRFSKLILNQSFAVKFSQIYTKGKTTIHQFITDEKPEFVSLALDGWSQHHHGYIGSIASKSLNKIIIKICFFRLHYQWLEKASACTWLCSFWWSTQLWQHCRMDDTRVEWLELDCCHRDDCVWHSS